MNDENDLTSPPSTVDQLNAIVGRMLESHGRSLPKPMGLLAYARAPIDTTKPNQHDSKAEFQCELQAVEQSIEHILGLIDLFVPQDGKTDEEHRIMLERLRPIIDQKLRTKAPNERPGDSVELIRRNIADIGGTVAILLILIDFLKALQERLAELEDQESKFWSLSHRAPDYYARAIALRLAKLYAQEISQRPTIGTSAITGDPSTAYLRALKEVFEVLEIKSGARAQAEWAVDQLRDEDLRPQTNILGNVFRDFAPPEPHNRLADIIDALAKKRGET